ncbi:AraC family transcriptional regulator [Enterovibrio coralii]|uniref:HTH araC/xylS-type domain-containing protein n=1 Tax=Enterovibrio coralii TaxID=294935 RepID=A0A135I4X3_9GAMM|nr:AraC family transcriptional regulator [Enterovibrio coralii]KXF80500.1 hypothetical protein ATN88_07360 [Enterovibrio coralii]
MKHFKLNLNWILLLKDLSIAPDKIVLDAKLPTQAYDENYYFTVEQYYRFWKSLRNAIDKPGFAIDVVSAFRPEMFSPPIFAALCSKDFSQALSRIQAYKSLIGPMTLNVVDDGMTIKVTIDGLANEPPLPTELIEMELVFFAHLIRMGTRDNIVPRYVETSAQIEDIDIYNRFFGTEVKTGKQNTIWFERSDTIKPFLTENSDMLKLLETSIGKLMLLNGFPPTTCALRTYLTGHLSAGLPSMETAAKHLAISSRTLQRRLQDESTQFSQVVAELRDDLAKYYLTHSNHDIAEVAFLLGYKAQSSFFRAFALRNQITPSQFRSQARKLSA